MKFSHTSQETLLPSIWEQNYSVSHLLSIYTHNIIYELAEKNSSKKYILKILDKKYFHKKLYQTLFSSNCNLFLLPIDITEDSHFVYFIYRYCPCLTDLLLVREFSYTELSVFVEDIGNAILFLHENHITHCDIAPGNIFMEENGHFLLGDFSSSRFEKKAVLPNVNIAAGISCKIKKCLPAQALHKNDHRSFLLAAATVTAISCKIKNFGCQRTGNTPFFSPPDYSHRQNGYYIDCYGFAMLLFLLLNEFKPPSEDDYIQLHPFSISQQTSNPNDTSCNSDFEIKELLLSILVKSSSKEPPDFHMLFFQLKDMFQNASAQNPIFHTTVIQQENTDFFLRTIPITNKKNQQSHCKQHNINPVPPQAAEPLNKNHTGPKLSIFLYGFLFLSILLFSISFYRSLITKQQRQTNITQSVLSEQDKKIFMNKQNLTSVDFLQENHSVEILVLSENNITSVKPLAELTQLLILDLSCNQQLTDILSLTNLKYLQQLVLTDTNITEEEYAVLQNSLPGCTILY